MDFAVRAGKNRQMWREAVTMILYAASFVLLASSAVAFAQAATTEFEKWMAPITMGFTNLLGSIMAFLTAREMSRNDNEKKFLKQDNDRKTVEIDECEQDRKAIRGNLDRANRRIDKLMERAGIPDDADDPPEDRRTKSEPGYKGPKRRRDDKGPKQSPKLPPDATETLR